MSIIRISFFCILLMLSMGVWGQRVVEHEQVAFPDSIPAGGYSGICWLGGDRYAVVTDNASHHDGFFVFRITIDSVGAIQEATSLGFRGNEEMGHDNEDIAWYAPQRTVFVSGEADNQVRELDLEGKPTGRTLPLPTIFAKATHAYGLEALTYNAMTHRFWLTSESTLTSDGLKADPVNKVKNRLRLQSFDDRLQPGPQYFYEMDPPEVEYHPEKYAMGVSALAALDDGRLLVLEREFAVPETIVGAQVYCKLYVVSPTKETPLMPEDDITKATPMAKQLLAEWSTAIGLLHVSLANYEGMCLGPRLADGGQVVVLLADSQYQYGGVLTDWLKTVVIY